MAALAALSVDTYRHTTRTTNFPNALQELPARHASHRAEVPRAAGTLMQILTWLICQLSPLTGWAQLAEPVEYLALAGRNRD